MWYLSSFKRRLCSAVEKGHPICHAVQIKMLHSTLEYERIVPRSSEISASRTLPLRILRLFGCLGKMQWVQNSAVNIARHTWTVEQTSEVRS